MTTDDHVLTIEQGGLIAVDGVTLSNGSPRSTVSGTSISAGLGGIVISSDTVRLPAVDGSASSMMIAFTGAAIQSAKLSRFVFWVCVYGHERSRLSSVVVFNTKRSGIFIFGTLLAIFRDMFCQLWRERKNCSRL